MAIVFWLCTFPGRYKISTQDTKVW